MPQNEFEKLPDELLVHLFSFFTNRQELLKLGATSTLFHRIAHDEILMKNASWPALNYRQRNGEKDRVFANEAEVSCMAELPDNRIVCSTGNNLCIWDIERNSFITLKGHTNFVTCVAIHSKNTIVSGANDNTLRIWNTQTGECLNILKGHTHWVSGVARLSENTIISGSWDKTLRIWNTETGECIKTIGTAVGITCLDMLSAKQIICGSVLGKPHTWNIQTGENINKIMRNFITHAVEIMNCIIKISENIAVSGAKYHPLAIWNTQTEKLIKVLFGHKDEVTCIAKLSENTIVSGSFDGTLRIWDIERGECLRILTKRHSINCVLKLSDNRIASGADDGSLHIWAFKPLQEKKRNQLAPPSHEPQAKRFRLR